MKSSVPWKRDALDEAGRRISHRSVEVMNRLLNSVTCIMGLVIAPLRHGSCLYVSAPRTWSGVPAVRGVYRIMLGAVATSEVGPEKRRGRERLGDLRTSPQNRKL